jgi:hypothetical protein
MSAINIIVLHLLKKQNFGSKKSKVGNEINWKNIRMQTKKQGSLLFF